MPVPNEHVLSIPIVFVCATRQKQTTSMTMKETEFQRIRSEQEFRFGTLGLLLLHADACYNCF